MQIHQTNPFGYIFKQILMRSNDNFQDVNVSKLYKLIMPPGNIYLEHSVHDDLEGWVEALDMLCNSYMKPFQNRLVLDFSQYPCSRCHRRSEKLDELMIMLGNIQELFDKHAGEKISNSFINMMTGYMVHFVEQISLL